MATASVESVRAKLADLPGAFEGSHHGHPDLRGPKGLFGSLWPEEGRVVLRLPPALAESLETAGPGRRIVSRFGGMAWLSLELGRESAAEVADLMDLAWAARHPGGPV